MKTIKIGMILIAIFATHPVLADLKINLNNECNSTIRAYCPFAGFSGWGSSSDRADKGQKVLQFSTAEIKKHCNPEKDITFYIEPEKRAIGYVLPSFQLSKDKLDATTTKTVNCKEQQGACSCTVSN